jgi:four helix bundle protein
MSGQRRNRVASDYRELEVWAKAHALTLAVYTVTTKFPREENYGLTSQIRRASASIPSNIAEGCGRGGDPEFARFLQIAAGSASELDYQLLLAKDLEYVSAQEHDQLADELTQIRKMLTALIQRIRARLRS